MDLPSPTMNVYHEKLCIVMVGAPARGKSSIAMKLKKYINLGGYKVQVFNVGKKRRETLGNTPSTFFSDMSPEDKERRLQLSLGVLDDLLDWLLSEGDVGIHDATNTTQERRDIILQKVASRSENLRVLFIESICTDECILAQNIKLKLRTPDYSGIEPEVALADFKARMKHYETKYQPLEMEGVDRDRSFVKLIDVGRHIIVNNIDGYLQSMIVMFLCNYHIEPRTLWLTRHGESQMNELGLIGGDSALSPEGEKYAHALAKFVTLQPELKDCFVWTSTLQRTLQTVKFFPSHDKMASLPLLNEIDAGKCDGMTYEQIAATMPEEYELRSANKLSYRYPRGESYLDLIARVRPAIIELERMKDVTFIVAHQAVLRALLGYFLDKEMSDLPHMEVPLHCVFRLLPTPYGIKKTLYKIDLAKFEAGEEVFWTIEE
eukprot:TRINITY_DN10932_c0_g1_i1.p1 TRINITY_DN10932_c0_g1~~TRINITY_DN10932_c0_g1_i1.p1  ORF type:complete len:434 (+),score=101.68 TRINITY_DN10932_c0_g1_i1:74-1375(+)